MTTTAAKREQLMRSFGDKEYRDLYVSNNITNTVALQIRATRERRGWTQEELGRRADMKQEVISQLENPDYGRYTLKTLKRLASALDVALVVRLAPFAQLAEWIADPSPDTLAVPSFEEDIDSERGIVYLNPADTLDYAVRGENFRSVAPFGVVIGGTTAGSYSLDEFAGHTGAMPFVARSAPLAIVAQLE